jgi:putative PIN family toxin of toxin-antitoxin system
VRVVLDTNVIVAGIVAEGLCREILEVHVPEHTVVLSQVLWDELLTTLRRKFGLTPDDLPILALYRQHAEWCKPSRLAETLCRDPDDDWVLATALEGRAEAIVSGDTDLLALESHEGIEVLSPRQFVARQTPGCGLQAWAWGLGRKPAPTTRTGAGATPPHTPRGSPRPPGRRAATAPRA